METTTNDVKKPHIDFCIICGKPFDYIDVIPSPEHIIPRALGNKQIITYCVCEKCNNGLGTVVDSYLTDHIFVKMIRRQKLKKDEDIQLFDSKLKDKNSGREFFVYNDHAEIIPKVIEVSELDDESIQLRVDAANLDEGIRLARKKIKRLHPDWTDNKIDEMLSREGAIKTGTAEKLHPTLQQIADMDKPRWMLECIKMAYEYACERLGTAYTKDDVAVKYRNWLYEAVQGKKEYTNQEYMELNKHCNVFDNRAFAQLSKTLVFEHIEKPQYILEMLMDRENKLICAVRILDEDLLTFTVLLSKDALKYLCKDAVRATLVFEDGKRLDI